MKLLGKIFRYALALIAILLLMVFILYPPQYVYRVLVWQDASYNDFEKFDNTEIQKADTPYNFKDGRESQLRSFKENFQSLRGVGSDIDVFLQSKQTYAFIVIQNDTILYENYFYDWQRDHLQTSFSVSKSLLSLLVGITVSEGKIENIEEPITEYIPELLDRDINFMKITIGDLLRMRSGISYDSKIKFPLLNCDDPLTYYYPDLRKVALTKTNIESDPDQKFLYNNYNPLLLGIILERATGMSISELMERYLWERIGAEYDATWSTDNHGFEKMESGFNAVPIDMAKIGRLVLNNGMWEEQELVPTDWLDRSTKPIDTLTFRSGHRWGYSHMWWQVIKENNDYDIFGCGRFGQFLYISPSHNIIIVRHGLQSEDFDDDDWTSLFQKYISSLPD